MTAETSPEAASQLFEDAFAAVWSGAAESDGFNALVLHAGLNWRQVVLVRAYAKYLRQVGIRSVRSTCSPACWQMSTSSVYWCDYLRPGSIPRPSQVGRTSHRH